MTAATRRAAGAVLVAALALATCSGGDDGGDDGSGSGIDTSAAVDDTPVVGGTLRLGIARLTSLDPALASPDSPSASIVADLLFDGLTDLPNGATTAEPAIAESWQSPDGGTTWTFTLDPDARFSDGRAVSAADAELSLERVVAAGSASLVASRLDAVAGFGDFIAAGGQAANADLAGIRAADAATLEITLTRPMASLPELLAAPAYGIVSNAGLAADGAAFGDGPSVSSGPFRLAGRDGDVVSVVRAPDRETFLDQIDLRMHADLAVAFDAFEARRLDWTLVPPSRVDVAAERFGADGFVPFQAELFFGFNLADPRFADVRFRQAIVQAVDRAAIVNAVYFGIAAPLAGIVPAGVAGAGPRRCAAGCTHDPAAAEALLAQAFPDGAIPEVPIDFADGADEAAVAGIIKQNLEAMGIPVTLRPHAAQEYSTFALSGNQGLASLGWIGVQAMPEDYLDRLFRTGSADNLTGFSDAAVDDLLTRAAATTDPDARVDLLGQAEAAILALAPTLGIGQFQLLSVASDRVHDLDLGVTGTFDPEAVWLTP